MSNRLIIEPVPQPPQPQSSHDEQSARANVTLPDSEKEWLGPGRFAAVLGLLIFAAFPQVLPGMQTFIVRDYGFFAFPLAHFQRECFWHGEVPLWNPYNDCGVPFLAQWNTMPLYPPALVYLLLPLTWSLSFFCLLHVFIAGMGMYFLARRWTGSAFAAAVAGMIFAFNGLSLNLLMWPSHIATLSWMPWVVFCVERCWRGGGRSIAVAVIAGALQMLAGGPETILLTWLFLAALWVVEAARGGFKNTSGGNDWWKAALRFVVVVVLVAGVAAAQILPFMDLASHSERGTGYADTRWSMPKWGWASFLVPRLFGQLSNIGVFYQYDQGWTSSYYFGVGAVVLALLAAWKVRERRVWLLTAVTAFSLLMALGEHSFVYRAARSLLPQISMVTYPVKFVLLTTFCVPLLAAFAAAFVQNQNLQQKRSPINELSFIGGLLLALTCVILFCAWHFRQPTEQFGAILQSGISRAAFLAAIVAALVVFQRTVQSKLRSVLPFVLIGLLWLDVVTHEPSQNPSVPTWIYTPGMAKIKLAMKPQPALGESRAMVAPAAESQFLRFTSGKAAENYVANRLGYFADCNVLDEVPKVDGFFSLYPGAYGDLVGTVYGATNADFSRLADFMGVSQITAPGQFLEWTNRDSFLPIVTSGQKPVFVDGTNALNSLFERDFDGRQYVVLPTEAKASVNVTNQTESRARVSRFSATTIEAEAEAAQPFLIVISQAYYHCWRAYLDDQPVKLLRANYAFQAVESPAGKHKLRLVYEDHAFRAGAAISAISLVACVGIWVMGARFGARVTKA